MVLSSVPNLDIPFFMPSLCSDTSLMLSCKVI